jgi:hypothetical protein
MSVAAVCFPLVPMWQATTQALRCRAYFVWQQQQRSGWGVVFSCAVIVWQGQGSLHAAIRNCRGWAARGCSPRAALDGTWEHAFPWFPGRHDSQYPLQVWCDSSCQGSITVLVWGEGVQGLDGGWKRGHWWLLLVGNVCCKQGASPLKQLAVHLNH